ncbi:uncharacterized protein PgNI_00110 [Pyricularia grisea]|uniref:Extracellular membrane protein CFEM domain-containing protein n=1 Tax=Pyricularia grisea TaxID=148305 RepID=A0A6P8BG93_PYRGI|nr:uncharacterized protein PgNI_00110 [Pyricularia grisea]TLD15649.1 hypothetical protein PgNI_00110 [Pyricularia grisea]
MRGLNLVSFLLVAASGVDVLALPGDGVDILGGPAVAASDILITKRSDDGGGGDFWGGGGDFSGGGTSTSPADPSGCGCSGLSDWLGNCFSGGSCISPRANVPTNGFGSNPPVSDGMGGDQTYIYISEKNYYGGDRPYCREDFSPHMGIMGSHSSHRSNKGSFNKERKKTKDSHWVPNGIDPKYQQYASKAYYQQSANMGPQQQKANMGPQQQKANMGPQQQNANMGPQQQKANMGPQQLHSKVNSKTDVCPAATPSEGDTAEALPTEQEIEEVNEDLSEGCDAFARLAGEYCAMKVSKGFDNCWYWAKEQLETCRVGVVKCGQKVGQKCDEIAEKVIEKCAPRVQSGLKKCKSALDVCGRSCIVGWEMCYWQGERCVRTIGHQFRFVKTAATATARAAKRGRNKAIIGAHKIKKKFAGWLWNVVPNMENELGQYELEKEGIITREQRLQAEKMAKQDQAIGSPVHP